MKYSPSPKLFFSILKQHTKTSSIFLAQMPLAMVLCCTAVNVTKGRMFYGDNSYNLNIWATTKQILWEISQFIIPSKNVYITMVPVLCEISKVQLCNLVSIPDAVK